MEVEHVRGGWQRRRADEEGIREAKRREKGDGRGERKRRRAGKGK